MVRYLAKPRGSSYSHNRWLTEQDDCGQRRLDLPDDWVRREIETALTGEATVIPLLVDDASPPLARALAMLPSIQALSDQQAAKLRTEEWDRDLDALVQRLLNIGLPPVAAQSSAMGSGVQREKQLLQVPPDYLSWLQHHHASVELLGQDQQQGQSITLESVYVPAVTLPERGQADGEQARDTEHRREPFGDTEAEKPPALLLDRLAEQSLYLPGAPGSGKSTFCRWVVLQCATLGASGSHCRHPLPAPEGFEEAPPDPLSDRLPVLVPLREFWDLIDAGWGQRSWTREGLEQALSRWLERQHPAGLEPGTLPAWLRAGRTLLLLVGTTATGTPLTCRWSASRSGRPRPAAPGPVGGYRANSNGMPRRAAPTVASIPGAATGRTVSATVLKPASTEPRRSACSRARGKLSGASTTWPAMFGSGATASTIGVSRTPRLGRACCAGAPSAAGPRACGRRSGSGSSP